MARSANRKKRIGIFGGTFNPIHLGHLNLARHALEKLMLDKIYFVPAYVSPHKSVRDDMLRKDRLAMVRRSIKGNKKYALCLFEIERAQKSYSIETLKYFRKKYGDNARLFFLIGSDSLKGIDSWRDIDKAYRLAEFVVAERPGYPMKVSSQKIKKMHIPKKNISSTRIRSLTKKGKPIKDLVPAGVERYIRAKHLYGA